MYIQEKTEVTPPHCRQHDYVENTRQSTKNIIELVSEFSKITE